VETWLGSHAKFAGLKSLLDTMMITQNHSMLGGCAITTITSGIKKTGKVQMHINLTNAPSGAIGDL